MTATNDRLAEPVLTVRGLRTYFHVDKREVRAVDGVDLDLHAGRTLCLVGESGCGKSLTALSIMQLVDEPGRIMPGSSIRLAGRELVGLSERDLRGIRGRDVSMIFQEPMTSLNPVQRIGAQIAEAVRLHDDVSRQEAADRAVEMLRLVGISAPEQRAREYPHEMSGGMRQRVMIAMALACNPKLLIADEPTTALDVTIQAQILELIAELRERVGMAVLFITHDLGVVADIADEVAVMYAGQVIERGGVEEVLGQPQHPYTQALMESIPLLGMDRGKRLEVIEGMVPAADAWPVGCRFAPRCRHAFERCFQEPPELRSEAGREAACWLVGGERTAREEAVSR